MTSSSETIVNGAARLCDTLDRLGNALVALDTATLLETEETLGRLVAILATCDTREDRERLEALVQRGRESLLRCRRLGASFTGVSRLRLVSSRGAESYDREGTVVDEGLSGSTVRVTV